MTNRGALYLRTPEGEAAARLATSDLPRPYRDLLGAVGTATIIPFDPLSQPLLDDLEAIGLVESVSLEWIAALCELETLI